MLRGMMRGRSPPRHALCAEPEKQNMKKEKAGRERACRRMQALFSSGFARQTRYPAQKRMAFFNQAVTVLQSLVVAIGAILSIWGGINLLEGYGGDNPGAKSQGAKQFVAGAGVALIGTTLIPLLTGLFGG